MLVCDWLIWVRWKGRKDRGSRSYDWSWPIVTFLAGGNQPIRGCSIGNLKQTERNEVKKMKQTKEKKMNLEKKNKKDVIENEWDVGKKEDGRWKEQRALRITSKCTVGIKVITIRHYIEMNCPKTGQCPNSAFTELTPNSAQLKQTIGTKFAWFTTKNMQQKQVSKITKELQNLKITRWNMFTESGIYSLLWILLF